VPAIGFFFSPKAHTPVCHILNFAYSLLFVQLIIALTAGPIDKAFGKDNTPAFGIGGAFAFICAILALVLLPKTRGTSSAVIGGGH
jgi:solute carrier family 45 protein 1/2/4